eukprot:1384325-Rhodomonas_salina.1
MVWYKQGAAATENAYKYRSLCNQHLNTNTTPSRCTIHLAEEWTGGVDVGWDSLTRVPGYPGRSGTGVDCVVGELGD